MNIAKFQPIGEMNHPYTANIVARTLVAIAEINNAFEGLIDQKCFLVLATKIVKWPAIVSFKKMKDWRTPPVK